MGYAHVLRVGRKHGGEQRGDGAGHAQGPAAILFPHAGNHRLVVGDDDAADTVCAKIDLGGLGSPLEQGLPPVLSCR
jgi:hypothetical protein